ncbi:MAG: hypothetical protein ACI4OI_04115, partial [Gemmiger sp.]
MTNNTLLAGAGKAEIRFREEDFPLKAFTGIHDAIHVRVLLLRDALRLALVSIELTSLPTRSIRHFQAVCSEASGVEPEHILISVTHTFSAPHIPMKIKTEQEQALSDRLYARIDEAIREAAGRAACSLGGTTLEYGEVSCRLNINRNVPTAEGWWIGRNENAYSDHTVRVVNLRHRNRLFARLVNYDIQPSVMDQSEALAGGRLISGDMAGAACRVLEQQDGVTALFLPGCAGDQAPLLRAVRAGQDLHEAGFVLAEEFGAYLAERVLGAGVEKAEARALSLTTATALLPEQKMKYETKALRPHTAYSFELTGNSVEVPLVLAELGGVRLLATAPELNSELGAKLRSVLGEQMLIGTLVNGAVKYLPQAQDFARVTYTAMNTKLG